MKRLPDPRDPDDFEGMWLCALAVLVAAAVTYGGLLLAATRYLPRPWG